MTFPVYVSINVELQYIEQKPNWIQTIIDEFIAQIKEIFNSVSAKDINRYNIFYVILWDIG